MTWIAVRPIVIVLLFVTYGYTVGAVVYRVNLALVWRALLPSGSRDHRLSAIRPELTTRAAKVIYATVAAFASAMVAGFASIFFLAILSDITPWGDHDSWQLSAVGVTFGMLGAVGTLISLRPVIPCDEYVESHVPQYSGAAICLNLRAYWHALAVGGPLFAVATGCLMAGAVSAWEIRPLLEEGPPAKPTDEATIEFLAQYLSFSGAGILGAYLIGLIITSLIQSHLFTDAQLVGAAKRVLVSLNTGRSSPSRIHDPLGVLRPQLYSFVSSLRRVALGNRPKRGGRVTPVGSSLLATGGAVPAYLSSRQSMNESPTVAVRKAIRDVVVAMATGSYAATNGETVVNDDLIAPGSLTSRIVKIGSGIESIAKIAQGGVALVGIVALVILGLQGKTGWAEIVNKMSGG